MVKIDLPYINLYKSRGGTYAYYRRSGQRVRIKEELGSSAFLKRYNEIHKQFEKDQAPRRGPGSIEWCIQKYYESPDYKKLAAKTQEGYCAALEPFREKFGDLSVSGLSRKVILAWRDVHQDRPATANNIVRVLKLFFNFCLDREWLKENPAMRIKQFKTGDGTRAWTTKEIERFSTKATGPILLAFFISLYTGQRKSDVLKLKWSDISGSAIAIRQQKTGKNMSVPILPILSVELESAKKKTRGFTVIQRMDGRPYTTNGFNTLWKKQIKKLSMKGCAFHGLRKSMTSALLEAGCTTEQVRAITGHETSAMIERYGKSAKQKTLARQGMKMLENARDESKSD